MTTQELVAAVEITTPIHRGVPWIIPPIRLRDGKKPFDLSGHDVVFELRGGDSFDSSLLAVLTVERNDNEGLIQASLSDVQTLALAAAGGGQFVIGTISGPRTNDERTRLAFGEIPVLEVATP